MYKIAGRDITFFYNTAVTIGKFDGLHSGHMSLIDKTLEYKKKGLQTVLFTFMLNDDMKYIYSDIEREKMVCAAGIDTMIEFPFDKETRRITAEEYIRKILAGRLRAKAVIVGEDFRFGRGRFGSTEMIKDIGSDYGIDVNIVKSVKINDIIVSSSYIRELIIKGDVRKAKDFLGRYYMITGNVEHGRQLGRKIGIPTLNQTAGKDKLLPPNGVYASISLIDGKRYRSITNVGCKPTVNDNPENIGIETNVFDFNSNVYDRNIEVELIDYIRPEKRFDSVDELRKQMLSDIEISKSIKE